MVLGFLTLQGLVPSYATRLALSVLCIAATPIVTPSSYKIYLLSRESEVENVKIGLMIRKNTSPAARVAETAIGSTLYFSQRRGIDLLGKCDPYVARIPTTMSGAKAGHNRFDFDYSLGVLKPDIVVNPISRDEKDGARSQSATHPLPADSRLRIHPFFRKHCFPNPINISTQRQIYICDWSREMKNKDNWTDISTRK
jgi:hypothetical protein